MITNLVACVLLAGSTAAVVDAAVAAKALALVQRALESEQRWTKVHAAEALLAVGRPGEVARAFEGELARHGGEPQYRIGIWRVLAQAAGDQTGRQRWIRKIADAFLDTAGPDRLHAAETLGKLGYRASTNEIAAFEDAARGADGPLAANALWVLTTSGRAGADTRLAALLARSGAGSGAPIDDGTRATAAYAMRFLPALSPAASDALAAAAADDRSDGITAASLISAAFVHASASRKPPLAAALERDAHAGDADVKTEVCGAFATAGDDGAVRVLTTLLSDASIDVRIAAAHAILAISDRR